MCGPVQPALEAVKHRSYATSSQIGLLESHNSGLIKGDTEVLLKHGFEDGSGYPLSVDEDAVGHAGVHRLQKVPGALGDYDDLVVLSQMPALQLAVGEVYREIPSAPGSASLLSSKKAISVLPSSSSTQSA